MTYTKMTWLDIETTGLSPVNDAILEIGMIVTDQDLNIEAERAWLVDPGEKLWAIEKMDPFVRDMHMKSGLLGQITVEHRGLPAWQVKDEAIQWLKDNNALDLPMCGSSIAFDRTFLRTNMAQLDDAFGYRSIDVSSIKELNKMWEIAKPHINFGAKSHRGLDDLRDSIAELKYYRTKVFK